eukprot:jgi/Botrbrau1/2970/Bobra.0026s0037.3
MEPCRASTAELCLRRGEPGRPGCVSDRAAPPAPLPSQHSTIPSAQDGQLCQVREVVWLARAQDSQGPQPVEGQGALEQPLEVVVGNELQSYDARDRKRYNVLAIAPKTQKWWPERPFSQPVEVVLRVERPAPRLAAEARLQEHKALHLDGLTHGGKASTAKGHCALAHEQSNQVEDLPMKYTSEEPCGNKGRSLGVHEVVQSHGQEVPSGAVPQQLTSPESVNSYCEISNARGGPTFPMKRHDTAAQPSVSALAPAVADQTPAANTADDASDIESSPSPDGVGRLSGAQNVVEPLYAGVFLTESAILQLRKRITPSHPNTSGDHMTVLFSPGWQELEDMLKLPIGVGVQLYVTGLIDNESFQVLMVKPPLVLGERKPNAPHITLSVAKGVPAKMAGQEVQRVQALLSQGEEVPKSYTPMGLELQGTIGVKMTDGSVLTSASKLRKLRAAARLQSPSPVQASPVNHPHASPMNASLPPKQQHLQQLQPEPRGGEAASQATPRSGEAGSQATPNSAMQGEGAAEVASEGPTTVLEDSLRDGPARLDARTRVRFAPDPVLGREQGQAGKRTPTLQSSTGRGWWEAGTTPSAGTEVGGLRSPPSTSRGSRAPQLPTRVSGLEAFAYRGSNTPSDWLPGEVKVLRRGSPQDLPQTPSSRQKEPSSTAKQLKKLEEEDEAYQALQALDALDLSPQQGGAPYTRQWSRSLADLQAPVQLSLDLQSEASPGSPGPEDELDTLPSTSFFPLDLDSATGGGSVRELVQGSETGAPSQGKGPLQLDPQTWQQLFGKPATAGETRRPRPQPTGRHGGPDRPGPSGEQRKASQRKLFTASPKPARAPGAQAVEEDERVKELAHTWLSAGGLEEGNGSDGEPSAPVNNEHVDQLLETFPELTPDMASIMIRIFGLVDALREGRKAHLEEVESKPGLLESQVPDVSNPRLVHGSKSTPNLYSQTLAEGLSGRTEQDKFSKALQDGEAVLKATSLMVEAADELRHRYKYLLAESENYHRLAREAQDIGQPKYAAQLEKLSQRYHGQAIEARQATNEIAFEAFNKSIVNRWRVDLHGMHKDEAVARVQEVISSVKNVPTPGGCVVQVITGQGKHSLGGKAIILPAVLSLLLEERLHFRGSPRNAGVVEVLIPAPDTRKDH